MSSRPAAILAATLLALFVSSQGASAQGAAAPPVHPGTKLAFPASLGGAQLQSSSTTGNGRSVAYSYRYTFDGMRIAVLVFDGGRRVPNGSSHPLVIDQFNGELLFAEQEARSSGLGHFERPAVPSNCAYGAVTFRCVTYSATGQTGRIYSKMLLTGFRDSYVRINIDWGQTAGQTGQSAAGAERALQSFVPALMR